jgi:hypothetical protein
LAPTTSHVAASRSSTGYGSSVEELGERQPLEVVGEAEDGCAALGLVGAILEDA